jgi:hypothetical protein
LQIAGINTSEVAKLDKYNFDPNQPRVPAGEADAGELTGENSGREKTKPKDGAQKRRLFYQTGAKKNGRKLSRFARLC